MTSLFLWKSCFDFVTNQGQLFFIHMSHGSSEAKGILYPIHDPES